MSGVILPGMLKGDPRNAKPDLQTWQFGFLFFFSFFFENLAIWHLIN